MASFTENSAGKMLPDTFRNLDSENIFKNRHSVVQKGRNKTNTPLEKARISVIDTNFTK